VVMLRPTESKIVFLQQLGRGLRAAEGKLRLEVIDFVGNHRVFASRLVHLLSLAPAATAADGAFACSLSASHVASGARQLVRVLPGRGGSRFERGARGRAVRGVARDARDDELSTVSGEPEKIRRLLAVIKKDFDEAADLRVLNCSSDGGCVAADPWPRRGHQDHDAEANAAQVVLVTKTLVSRDQDFVAIEYRDCEQLAVFELVPSFFKDRVDFMLSERPAERSGRALVEQNLHAEAWSSRLAAANSSTASTCSRVTPGNHSTN